MRATGTGIDETVGGVGASDASGAEPVTVTYIVVV